MATTFHISPIGEFVHPWLNKADTKFNEDGLFHTKLVLKGPKADDLKAKIEGAAKAFFNDHTAEMKPGEAKKWNLYLPFEDLVDDETGDPTGETEFTFKQNAKIRLRDGSTKNVEIELRDSKDNIIDVPVFGGSEGRIMFSMRGIAIQSSREAGVRLDFFRVQVTKLQQGGGSSRGFGEVEDGYVADASDAGFGDAGEEAGDY